MRIQSVAYIGIGTFLTAVDDLAVFLSVRNGAEMSFGLIWDILEVVRNFLLFLLLAMPLVYLAWRVYHKKYSVSPTQKLKAILATKQRTQQVSAAPPEAVRGTDSGSAAAEIPGETMAMLADRIRKYIEVCGIEIDGRYIGKILAVYAVHGFVQIGALPGTDAALVTKLCEMLQVFFGESDGNGPVFAPAGPVGLEQMRVDVELAASGKEVGVPHCGIGSDTFRGILREAENEFCLPEDDWRRVDKLLAACAPQWMPALQNWVARGMESMSAILIATGTREEEALDCAIVDVLLPNVSRSGGPNAVKAAAETFSEVFDGKNLPQTRRYLQMNQGVRKA